MTGKGEPEVAKEDHDAGGMTVEEVTRAQRWRLARAWHDLAARPPRSSGGKVTDDDTTDDG